MDKVRCGWVTNDPLYITYHDKEWGRFDSFFDDRYLFEMLTLEGAQAGLNWLTILRRREYYREAFANFEPAIVARYTDNDIKRLLKDERIIRNRLKIKSTISNAQAVLKVQNQFGSFHSFLWGFFDEKRIVNEWECDSDVPGQTEASTLLSKELKKLGFTFVGPVICYSFMEAVGLVDDHVKNCFVGTRLD